MPEIEVTSEQVTEIAKWITDSPDDWTLNIARTADHNTIATAHVKNGEPIIIRGNNSSGQWQVCTSENVLNKLEIDGLIESEESRPRVQVLATSYKIRVD